MDLSVHFSPSWAQDTLRQPHTLITPVYFSSKWYLCTQKAHMRSIQTVSLKFSQCSLEAVSMLVWLTVALSCPFKEDRQVLPLSTSLSPRQSMVWWPHVHLSIRDSPTAAGMKNPTASEKSSPNGTGALKCNKSKRGLEAGAAAPWTPKMTRFWEQNQAIDWQKFCLTQVTLPDH